MFTPLSQDLIAPHVGVGVNRSLLVVQVETIGATRRPMRLCRLASFLSYTVSEQEGRRGACLKGRALPLLLLCLVCITCYFLHPGSATSAVHSKRSFMLSTARLTRCAKNEPACVPLASPESVSTLSGTFQAETNPSTNSTHRLADLLIVPHPFYGHHKLCGSGEWIYHYASLHAVASARRSSTNVSGSGTSGRAGPLLVSVSVEAGLGDRIIGVLSEFFWAVLSGRALLLTSYADGTLPRWDEAVEPVLFNWRAEETEFPVALTAPLHYTYRGARGWGGQRTPDGPINSSLDAIAYLVNGGSHVFASEDMARFSGLKRGGRDRLFVSSNRGGVVALFRNPHHASWLTQTAGLTPDTAWACGFRALFAPAPAVLRAYGRTFDRLRSLRGRCIAANVRAGDAYLSGSLVMSNISDTHAAYFACAERAERSLVETERTGSDADAQEQPPVPWYVTSDSPELRRLVQQHWGTSRIITDPVTRYVHGDCRGHGHPCTPELETAAIVHAFGQLYAASLCATHVFSGGSGFGRSAAFAAPAAGAYVMEAEADGVASCARLSLTELAKLGAGN